MEHTPLNLYLHSLSFGVPVGLKVMHWGQIFAFSFSTRSELSRRSGPSWIVSRRVQGWFQHFDGLWFRTETGDSFREDQDLSLEVPAKEAWPGPRLEWVFFCL